MQVGAQSEVGGETAHVDTRYARRHVGPRAPGRDQGQSFASETASRGTTRGSW